MALLKKGSRGTEVQTLQTALIKLGYSVGKSGADGIFGDDTRQAVRQFQEDNELPVDGMAGPTTMDLLLEKAGDIKPAAAPATPQLSVYTSVMIGGASSDENKQARGGEAGNQTGKELKIQKWYNGDWKVVLRPKTDELATKLALQCEGACNNAYIGYDQGQRNTIYKAAKAADWDLAKINTPCECDCSSLMSMCCICVGLPTKYFYTTNLRTTKTLEAACKKTDQFDILTDVKYLAGKEYLKIGDILISNTHTCMVLSNGKKADTTPIIIPSDEDEDFIPTPDEPAEPVVDKGFTGVVTGGSVRVRVGPGTNYKTLFIAHKNDKFIIVGQAIDKEGRKWGLIDAKTSQWISMKYIKQV